MTESCREGRGQGYGKPRDIVHAIVEIVRVCPKIAGRTRKSSVGGSCESVTIRAESDVKQGTCLMGEEFHRSTKRRTERNRPDVTWLAGTGFARSRRENTRKQSWLSVDSGKSRATLELSATECSEN